MKYQIWEEGKIVYNGINNHKLLKEFKNKEQFEKALKKHEIIKRGTSYFFEYALVKKCKN